MTTKMRLLVVFLMILSICRYAEADTSTTSFTVSATVPNNCVVSANNLDFGNYNVITGSAVEANTSITVTCTSGTSYNVGLNSGLGSGASVTTRKMTQTSGGTNTLNYSLYQDAAYTNIWGDTVGSNTESGTGTGSGQTLTAYGKINASQSVPAASYQDTITVTVTF